MKHTSLWFLLLLSTAVGCGGNGNKDGGDSDEDAGTDAGADAGTDGGDDGGTDGGSDGGDDGGVVRLGNCHSSIPDKLSEWGLFEDIRKQVPEDGVAPYTLISPLFTDYALKYRFVTLRDGGEIEYFNDTTRWLSPPGTIYVKTFAYPPNEAAVPPQTQDQLIETRLLVHRKAEDDRVGCLGEDSCWTAHTYVYTEDQTDAICEAGGVNKSITFTAPGDQQVTIDNYRVPANAECAQCHSPKPETRTLGPSTGQLNRGNDYQGDIVDNQIDALYDADWLAPEPPPSGLRTTFDNPIALIEECQTPECYHEAARSWLDPNCAHCHAADGELDDQGLFLDYAALDPDNPTEADFQSWGICVTPSSAGNVTEDCEDKLDVVPGDPDNSLLPCRIASVVPGEMMPTLGRSVVEVDIVPIIRKWIENLPIMYPELPTLFPNCPIVVPE